MISTEEFKIIVKEISDLAFSNATNKLSTELQNNLNPENWNDDLKIKFKELVHEGFKSAQLKIVEQIIDYQKLLEQNKSDLKSSRQVKDKISENIFKIENKEINKRISILLHIGDGIAWQLFGAQVYIIRRFYINENTKTLEESNIAHSLKVAAVINENPDDFALITDITNFIQVSDLIVLQGDEIGILELKEGKVNDELIKLKDEIFNSAQNENKLKEIENNLEPKKLKQFIRMLKQNIRMMHTIEVLNTDEGQDIKSNNKIKILNSDHKTETYSTKISQTIDKLGDNNWSYDVDFGSIIHIGVYKPPLFTMAQTVIPAILKDCKHKLIIDYSSILKNLSEPLFAKPLSKNDIQKILFDDIKIIIGLNLDKFFSDFEKYFDVTTKVLSRKETMKLKELDKENAKNIFELDHQAFQLTDLETGNSMILGGGIISKLLYDNISPLTIYLDLKDSLSKIEND